MPLRIVSSVSFDVEDTLESIRRNLDLLRQKHIPYLPHHISIRPQFDRALIRIKPSTQVTLPFVVNMWRTGNNNSFEIVVHDHRVKEIQIAFMRAANLTYLDKVHVYYDSGNKKQTFRSSRGAVGLAHLALPEVLSSLKSAAIEVESARKEETDKVIEWFNRLIEALNTAAEMMSGADFDAATIYDIKWPVHEVSIVVPEVAKNVYEAYASWSISTEILQVAVMSTSYDVSEIIYSPRNRNVRMLAKKSDLDFSDLAEALSTLSDDRLHAKIKRLITNYLSAYTTLTLAYNLMNER